MCFGRYILRFSKAPQGRPVAVRISKLEDLVPYLRWLHWRGTKSQPSWRFFFEDETKRIGINVGQAEDEKARLKMKKLGNRRNFLETSYMSLTDSESTIR